jgi:hypothetical protein
MKEEENERKKYVNLWKRSVIAQYIQVNEFEEIIKRNDFKNYTDEIDGEADDHIKLEF